MEARDLGVTQTNFDQNRADFTVVYGIFHDGAPYLRFQERPVEIERFCQVEEITFAVGRRNRGGSYFALQVVNGMAMPMVASSR